MVLPSGATRFLVQGIVLLLVLTVPTTGAGETPEHSVPATELRWKEAQPDPPVACPQEVPFCPWSDPLHWIQWGETAGLEEIIATTRLMHAASPVDLPPPEEHPDYADWDDEKKRGVWLGSWLQIGSGENGPVPPEGSSVSTTGAIGEKILLRSSQSATTDVVGEESPQEEEAEESQLGGPRGLRPLWHMIEHGSVISAHPADDGEGWILHTTRGLFYMSDPDAGPDWMLPLSGWDRNAQASAPGPEGSRWLGMETGFRYMWFNTPGGAVTENYFLPPSGLKVFDAVELELVYEGFVRGDEDGAVLWTFTDVDGDGTDDLLVVTEEQELVAVELSTGEEIYREEVPPSRLQSTVGETIRSGWFGLPAFADATGDGTQDLFIIHWEDLLSEAEVNAGTQRLAASVVSGATGEQVWEETLEMNKDQLRVPTAHAAGDLDGDGQADLVFSEKGYSHASALGEPFNRVWGISGADGARLFVEESRDACPEPVCPVAYQPLALVDTEGDGRDEIVGLETVGHFFISWIEGMVVRTPGAVGTEQVHQLPADLGWVTSSDSLDWSTWKGSDGSGGALVSPTFFRMAQWSDTQGIEWAYRVDDQGLRKVEPSSPLRMFGVHPESGSTYGWTLEDDHWRTLDKALEPVQPGFRIVLSTHFWLAHTLENDTVPALLLPQSAGLRWVSGRDGSHIRDVERSLRDYFMSIFVQDGEVQALERIYSPEGRIYRYGPLEGKPLWEVPWDDLDADTVWDGADFTGDGVMELLLHDYPRMISAEVAHGGSEDGGSTSTMEEGERTPPRWSVWSAQDSEPLWEYEGDPDASSARVWGVDPLRGESAAPVFVAWRDPEDDRQHAFLQLVTEDEPRWEKRFDEDQQLYHWMHGRFLIREDTEEEGVWIHVHRMSDGQKVHSVHIPQEDRLLWTRLAPLSAGAPHLVVSHATVAPDAPKASPDAEPPDVRQYIRVYDASGSSISRFTAVDPKEPAVYDEVEEAWRPPLGVDTAYYSGVVRGWGSDELGELVLNEEGRTTVRSSATGSILAVSREGLWMNDPLDLNGDGREEIAFRGTSLGGVQWYAHDPAAEEEEDDGQEDARVQLGRQNETEDLDGFFDTPRDTPFVPAAWFLLALAAGLLGLRRGIRRP